ncbi:MAG: hypothetical protein ABSH22_09205, partial [Tepidisphaeraceae bacterium]
MQGIVSALSSTDNTAVSHYEHAPISEAIIDIQFRGPEASPEELESLQITRAAEYPEKQPLFVASVRLGMPTYGERPAFTSNNASLNGWAFVSADKRQ